MPSSRLPSGSRAAASASTSTSPPPPPRGSPEDGLSPLDGFFPLMSRHAPGKGSVRSVHSAHSAHAARLVLPDIFETDLLPLTLTQDALDEADRLMAQPDEAAARRQRR